MAGKEMQRLGIGQEIERRLECGMQSGHGPKIANYSARGMTGHTTGVTLKNRPITIFQRENVILESTLCRRQRTLLLLWRQGNALDQLHRFMRVLVIVA